MKLERRHEAMQAGRELNSLIEEIGLWAKEEDIIPHYPFVEVTRLAIPSKAFLAKTYLMGSCGTEKDLFHSKSQLSIILEIVRNPSLIDRFLCQKRAWTVNMLTRTLALREAKKETVIIEGTPAKNGALRVLTSAGASEAVFPVLRGPEIDTDVVLGDPVLASCVLLPIDGLYYAAAVECLSFARSESMVRKVRDLYSFEKEKGGLHLPNTYGQREESNLLIIDRLWEKMASAVEEEDRTGPLPAGQGGTSPSKRLPEWVKPSSAEAALLLDPAVQKFREWLYRTAGSSAADSEKLDRILLLVLDSLLGLGPLRVDEVLSHLPQISHFALEHELLLRLEELADNFGKADENRSTESESSSNESQILSTFRDVFFMLNEEYDPEVCSAIFALCPAVENLDRELRLMAMDRIRSAAKKAARKTDEAADIVILRNWLLCENAHSPLFQVEDIPDLVKVIVLSMVGEASLDDSDDFVANPAPTVEKLVFCKLVACIYEAAKDEASQDRWSDLRYVAKLFSAYLIEKGPYDSTDDLADSVVSLIELACEESEIEPLPHLNDVIWGFLAQ